MGGELGGRGDAILLLHGIAAILPAGVLGAFEDVLPMFVLGVVAYLGIAIHFVWSIRTVYQVRVVPALCALIVAWIVSLGFVFIAFMGWVFASARIGLIEL